MTEKIFENESIRLRPVEIDDAELLYAIENDAEEWGTSIHLTPRSLFFLREYVRNSSNDFFIDKQLRLVIERASGNEVAGIVDLFDYDIVCSKAEIGIFILKQYRENGYATAALRLLSRYAFTYLRLSQLYSYVDVGNTKALALFKRAGFENTAVLKRWFCFKGVYSDALVFQLFSSYNGTAL